MRHQSFSVGFNNSGVKLKENCIAQYNTLAHVGLYDQDYILVPLCSVSQKNEDGYRLTVSGQVRNI